MSTANEVALSRLRVPLVSQLNVAGLMTVVVGILMPVPGGVGYPTVPPGLVVLPAALAVAALARRCWGTLPGPIAPVVMLAGEFRAEAGILRLLRGPNKALRFTGAMATPGGRSLAMVTGLTATAAARARVNP